MSSMFQVVICAERSRGMRSISFTCHLEAFQREDSWGSFRFSVRRASNLRKPVGDLRFRTHQFPMETLKSREFNYSWNFISISRSMSCHDINVLFFFSFFITSRQTFMTQTSNQSPIPLCQILIFSVFNLINVVHVQFKVWDFETIWLIGNYFSH